MLVGLFALATAGCIVEPPYQSGFENEPFTAELTADAPVMTFDVVLTTVVRGSSATLVFRDVDARLRVAVTGDADVDHDAGADGFGAFFRPVDGLVTVPLRANGDCAAAPCPVQRVIVELLHPAPGERLTVSGDVRIQYGYVGETRHPGPAMTVEGFDKGTARRPGVEQKATVTAEQVALDEDHPLAVQPITFDLRPGDGASALDLVGVVALVADPANPAEGYDLSLRSNLDPQDEDNLVAQTERTAWAPAVGCPVPAGDCAIRAFVRLAWDGSAESATVGYGIETTLVSYADDGFAPGAGFTAAFAPTIATPPGAQPATASHGGTLVLERDNVRAEMRLRLALAGLPPPPDPAVLEVPGIVRLTYSISPAVPSIQPGQRYLGFSWSSLAPIGYNPGVDLIPDGGTHTVMLNLLEACVAGEDWTADIDFTMYDAARNGLGKPVTLTYRFDVAVTSLGENPIPPDASVGIGAAPTRPTQDSR